MKEKYFAPDIEIVEFNCDTVITLSDTVLDDDIW